jgi:predicted ester cyclase
MFHSERAARQQPGTEYGALKSLVSKLVPETRSSSQLTPDERANLETYLKYKTVQPHERPQFMAPSFGPHRRGFVHLPALSGSAGKELDHSALQGRFDEIEDVIVKGDRLWSVFTLRAKHVGPLYGQTETGKDLAITEMCCIRFEAGKLAEGWFLGDEFSICRQIGIDVAVPHVSVPGAVTLTPTLTAGAAASASDIAARQKPGTDYGKLKSVVARRAPETRSNADLTDEERTNLACYLTYKTIKPHERPNYQTSSYKGHRRGIVHLSEFRGTPGLELDHGSLEGRLDEIEDVIVKGDRLWSAFTLRARHVGPLYGVAPTGNTLEMLEYCVMRFEAGKIAEAWFFGDELGVCRQLGIPIGIRQGA